MDNFKLYIALWYVICEERFVGIGRGVENEREGWGSGERERRWGMGQGGEDDKETGSVMQGGEGKNVGTVSLPASRRSSRTKTRATFNKKWVEYEEGFGTEHNFWAGLALIHRLTTAKLTRARFDMTNENSLKYTATYDNFSVSDSRESYKLHVGKCSPKLHDKLFAVNGWPFSTRDSDNSRMQNCSIPLRSGWWFDNCGKCNLNGVAGATGIARIHWEGVENFADS
ncbi:Tenascin-R [Lamellibrachia satsuma]|nr:Tenascin-R [Lamellibrachia satsuma]